MAAQLRNPANRSSSMPDALCVPHEPKALVTEDAMEESRRHLGEAAPDRRHKSGGRLLQRGGVEPRRMFIVRCCHHPEVAIPGAGEADCRDTRAGEAHC